MAASGRCSTRGSGDAASPAAAGEPGRPDASEDPSSDRLTRALDRFACRLDGEPLRGGMSQVLPVRRGTEPLMLKLLPQAAAAREALALRAFPSSASVGCLDHEEELGALLLERLEPASLAGSPVDVSITVQADLARRLAVPEPAPDGPVTFERLASDGWLDHLDGLRRRCPGVVSERAVTAAREAIVGLADDPTSTLTHGDLHSLNVHRDRTGAWRAIDPYPRVGTIAHESHTVIVERPRLGDLVDAGPGELRRRLDLFAEVAGVSADLAARLCQARAASSALHATLEGDATLAPGLAWMAEALTS